MIDLFEEIVRMRKAGQRGALAKLCIPRLIPSWCCACWCAKISIAGTIGGGCVEADVWAAAKT
jgi:xanthine dehydrogenase accessory factor